MPATATAHNTTIISLGLMTRSLIVSYSLNPWPHGGPSNRHLGSLRPLPRGEPVG